MTLCESLIRVAGEPTVYQLHELIYARFADAGRRDFQYTSLALPSGRAVLVRGAIPGTPLVMPTAGAEIDFSLRALVTVKARADGRRRPLARHKIDERIAWLARRGAEHGFELLHAAAAVERQPFDKPGRTAWLDVTDFGGRLRVGDPDRFRAALASGIGKGRAFGFGMLVLHGEER